MKELIEKYKKGVLTAEEEKLLEQYIESGKLELTAFEDVENLNQAIDKMEVPDPSAAMTDDFFTMLADKKAEQRSTKSTFDVSLWWVRKPVLRWAYSLVLIAVGLGAGWLINGNRAESDKLQNLSAEVTEMKELMMLSLLEKESISDRLKAVNLTSELPDASNKVVDALLQTLNNDDNVNVRLATLEALYVYTEDARVREGLIRSISTQESPLMQMALAEMMVALQEKKSVEAFRELLGKEETLSEVKDQLKQSIDILI